MAADGYPAIFSGPTAPITAKRIVKIANRRLLQWRMFCTTSVYSCRRMNVRF